MTVSAHTRRAALAFCGAVALGALALGSPALAQSVKARVGVIPIVGAAPLFVADGEGWLKQAGVDVATTTFESGPVMIQALASGTIDVYVGGVAPLGVARSRGVDVKVVASTATGENVFVAAPKLAAYFKDGMKPADAFKAFRAATGKAARLATQPAGSVPNTTLQYWLWEVAKVDKADAEVVPMGIDATQQAVLAEAVDGAIIREPALTIVQEKSPGTKLVAVGDEMFPGQPGTVVAVSGAFAKANPQAVQAVVAGVARGADSLKSDPKSVARHVAAALGKGIVSEATILKALTSPASKFATDPKAIIAPSKAMQAYQVKLGSLKAEVPLDELFDASYYDKLKK